MPTILTEEPIISVLAFSERIEHYMRKATKRSLWYRGCGDAAHRLVPTHYRHPTITATEGLLDLEKQILTDFKARSVPYVRQLPTTDLELLFLMQHHGVPTRLLDWTENPYIALFFALSTAAAKAEKGKIDYDAAVWALDPNSWNTKSLEHVSHKGGVLSAADELLKGYAPGIDVGVMNNAPVTMYGVHNSRRIVAQRGVFVIFGQSTLPLEEVYQQQDCPADNLVKLIVPADKVAGLLDDLVAMGITDSVLYPDLDGLAREIRRSAGFPT